MTGEELQQITSVLLDGRDMGASKYAQLLRTAKRVREGARPWMALRTVDTSKTWGPGDTYETLKDLPADFRKPYNVLKPRDLEGSQRTPIILISGDSVVYTYPTIFGAHLAHKDINNLHYFDYANRKFGITGRMDRSYTVHLHYLKTTTDPASDGGDLDAWTWDLSPDDGIILAYDIAIAQKGGIDYDEINARMVQYHGVDVRQLFSNMVKWDDELQRSALGK
jgi:hypothetical protein